MYFLKGRPKSYSCHFIFLCQGVALWMNYCEVVERPINYENVRTDTMNHSYCRSPPSICLSYLSQSPISLLRLLISTFPPFAFRSSHFALWPLSSPLSLLFRNISLPLAMKEFEHNIPLKIKHQVHSHWTLDRKRKSHPSLSHFLSLSVCHCNANSNGFYALSSLSWMVGAGSLLLPRARLKGGLKVWWIIILLLLIASPYIFLQYSRNLRPAF